MAALGPQAINFGISIGGGEAYLLPNISARGTLNMHWLMLVSVVLETALVYECIKYSVCTGRSFFAATHELKPYGFWPWFWAVVTILTWAWPAWMGGAIIAAERFTGIGNPPIFGLPPYYMWAVIALVLVLVVFYFSDRTYNFLVKVLRRDHVRQHRVGVGDHLSRGATGTLLAGADGLSGHHVPARRVPGRPAQDRRAGAVQPARRQPDVGQLLGDRRRLRYGPLRRPGDRRAPATRAHHRPGTALGHRQSRGAAQDAAVGRRRRLQPDPVVGDHRRPVHDLPVLGGRARLSATTTSSGPGRSRPAWRYRCRWRPSPRACSGRWPAG